MPVCPNGQAYSPLLNKRQTVYRNPPRLSMVNGIAQHNSLLLYTVTCTEEKLSLERKSVANKLAQLGVSALPRHSPDELIKERKQHLWIKITHVFSICHYHGPAVLELPGKRRAKYASPEQRCRESKVPPVARQGAVLLAQRKEG